MKKQVAGTWTTKDVLCHLVFWHETYASTATALLLGNSPELAAGTFKQLNQHAVAELGAVSPGVLVARFREAQGRLESVCSSPAADELRFSFRAGSKVWGFPEALQRISAHIANHLRGIKRQLRA